MWKVLATKEFGEWIGRQEVDARETILSKLRYLELNGPQLGRPLVDTLKGSAVKNLKELRVDHDQRPYRILFAFDSRRQAIVLCGGDKATDKLFYRRMIPLAEALFEAHQRHIEADGRRNGDDP